MSRIENLVPQFPLGMVLFPGMPLPLHIFEPRYRELLRDVLAADGRFGVVLIERGSEVGGGDVRASVGTRARIVDHEIHADGRAAVMAVGEERIRITEWVPDDPYPKAHIEAHPDQPVADVALLESSRDRAEALLLEAIDLAIALSPRPMPPPTIELPADHSEASMLMAALAPLSAFDKQRLLGAAGPEARIERLCDDLTAAIERFRFQRRP